MLGEAGPASAVVVSEVRRHAKELKEKAAAQGGGVQGYFVAVNQQWNPAYGIFEHGANTIDAAKRGDMRAVGREATHTGLAIAQTVAVAEGGAKLVEGGVARIAEGRAPKPNAPEPARRLVSAASSRDTGSRANDEGSDAGYVHSKSASEPRL